MCKKILVTGAGGYIGRHVVTHLLDNGAEVYAADIRLDDVDERAKKIETNISILETKINTLTELLHSEEVLNDYQKYNQINDEISELENQLNTLMEEWEALQ